jgi:hypothetical protein
MALQIRMGADCSASYSSTCNTNDKKRSWHYPTPIVGAPAAGLVVTQRALKKDEDQLLNEKFRRNHKISEVTR